MKFLLADTLVYNDEDGSFALVDTPEEAPQMLTGIANAGQITIDKVSGPVGEALIMTAAGLAVAIPAVLGYNVFGRVIHRIEADLEGFARDLRELLTHGVAPAPAPLTA